jgi:hypothetical protein
MSCVKKGSDGKTYYKVVYPRNNVVGWTSTMPENYRQAYLQACERANFEPIPSNDCNFTFSLQPRPKGECTGCNAGRPNFVVDGEVYREAITNGLSSFNNVYCTPAADAKGDYTNAPVPPPVFLGAGYIPPPPKVYPNNPSYTDKDSKYYNPIAVVSWQSYTY